MCECLKVLGDIAEALALEGRKQDANAVFEAVGQLRTHNILREHMPQPKLKLEHPLCGNVHCEKCSQF